jgi:REP element-mobilizing transposase RayT
MSVPREPNGDRNPNRDRKEAAMNKDRPASAEPNRDRKEAAPAEDHPAGREPNRDREGAACGAPLAYFITFHTYGTWLHGADRGSVDRQHSVPGTPLVTPFEPRRRRETESLQSDPVTLAHPARCVVERTIIEVAVHRGWTIHTLAIRSNHVHVVLSAPDTPERVMNSVKSWSTRRLVEAGLMEAGQRVWARHGSTRYLWKPGDLRAACRYVSEGQGGEL